MNSAHILSDNVFPTDPFDDVIRVSSDDRRPNDQDDLGLLVTELEPTKDLEAQVAQQLLPVEEETGCEPSNHEAFNDILTCSVCLQTFKNPKTLSCHHVFCFNCLEEWKRQRDYGNEIKCPECNTITKLNPPGIASLPNDFRIQQILDAIDTLPQSDGGTSSSPSDGPKCCDICAANKKQIEAVSRCTQCAKYFCGECRNKHNKNPALSVHQVLPVNAKTSEQICKIHPGETLRYLCKPCSKLLCTLCTFDHDTEHDMQPVEPSTISKQRQKIVHLKAKLIKTLSAVNNKKLHGKTIEEDRQRIINTEKAIRDRSEEIIKEVRKQEEALLNQLQKSASKIGENIDHADQFTSLKTSLEAMVSEVREVEGGDLAELLLKGDDLETRSVSLQKEADSVNKVTQKHQFMRFIPSKSVSIGTLQQGPKPSQSSKPSKNVPPKKTKQPSAPTVRPSVVGPTTFSIMQNEFGVQTPQMLSMIRLCGRVAFTPGGRLVIANQKAIRLLNDRGTITSSCSLKAYPNAVAVKEKELKFPFSINFVIASDKDRSIKVLYSGCDGKVKQSFGSQQLARPCGLAIQSNGNYVITDITKNALLICNSLGQTISFFHSGNSRDHSFRNPYRVSVDDSDNIIVSDCDNACLKIYDSKGEFKKVIRCVDANGCAWSPSAAVVDINGNFIVADGNQSRIALLGPDGVFMRYLLQWQDGIHWPNDMAYHPSGLLAVENYGSKTVTLYCYRV